MVKHLMCGSYTAHYKRPCGRTSRRGEAATPYRFSNCDGRKILLAIILREKTSVNNDWMLGRLG
jgi:hypothetical protein